MFALNLGLQLILTDAARAALLGAQVTGNRVTWQSDWKTWGVEERWEYPKQVGRALYEDCDGIALYKRALLIAAGVPSPCLLMTICRDPMGAGHAVLTVVTDRGDVILCNNHHTLTSPAQMSAEGYVFLYRQQMGKPIAAPWDVLRG